jgi:hypothetical protein
VILVAVDPALRSSGLAIFRDGVLVHASRVKSPSPDDVAVCALTMAQSIANFVPRDSRIHVAIEWPQIYRGPRAQGDPNDLPALAAVGVSVAALLGASVQSFTPRDWAGQVPKATKGNCKESPRAKRIRSRLSGPELAVWEALRSGDHDAVDAIGIGLHALGRGPASRAPLAGTTDRPSSRPA